MVAVKIIQLIGWNEQEIEKYNTKMKGVDLQIFNKFEPQIIPELTDVMDVKQCWNYSIALCSTNNKQLSFIITNWCRLYLIPSDIINLLILFSKINTVYSTTNEPGSGHPKNGILTKKYGWNEIEALKDENIIKIAVGNKYSLFLGDAGKVWFCGDVKGLRVVYEPIVIEWFIDNEVKIVDIECGNGHSLALDEDGKVYAWGKNKSGQCGVRRADMLGEPMLIKELEGLVVEVIKCGASHSYVGTSDGSHWLFGMNDDWECVTENEGPVLRPYKINDVVRRTCDVKDIVEVFPGYYCTKIVCLP